MPPMVPDDMSLHDAAPADHFPICINAGGKALPGYEVQHLRIQNLDAGKGQEPASGSINGRGRGRIKTFYMVYGIDPYLVEFRVIMHDQGDRVRVGLVNPHNAAHVEIREDIAVDDQEGCVSHEIGHIPDGPAGSQNFRLKSGGHGNRIVLLLYKIFNIIMQVMGIDDDVVVSLARQLTNQNINGRPARNGKKRLGQDAGMGQEPGAEAGRQDQGFHEDPSFSAQNFSHCLPGNPRSLPAALLRQITAVSLEGVHIKIDLFLAVFGFDNAVGRKEGHRILVIDL